jgi:hypothetical protein
MNEKFPEPMVVGYVAIDLPIAADGTVGYHPVETDVRLRMKNGNLARIIVKKWLRDHPHALEILEPWVESNQRYLIARGLLPESLTAEQIKPWRRTRAVAERIEEPGFYRYLFPGRDIATISRRILTEVIERPEGLGPITGEDQKVLDRERGYQPPPVRDAK